MVTETQRTKHVLVHLGPHKTGTTALQKYLSLITDTLTMINARYLHNEETHAAAIALSRGAFEEAEERLSVLSDRLQEDRCKTIILSQEDFSGPIPGRGRKRGVYTTLTKNLRVIERALRPHQVTFVFFVRPENEWLSSCYTQHLKYRTTFSSLADFQEHCKVPIDWIEKLQKPKETFGCRFVTIDYDPAPSAGSKALLSLLTKSVPHTAITTPVLNASPSEKQIRYLERVNAFSGFTKTAWFAKALVLNGWKPKPVTPEISSLVEPSFTTAEIALPALLERTRKRVNSQIIDDILPVKDVDLEPLAFERLPLEVDFPNASREDIHVQTKKLDYFFRGKSRLAKLTGLSISYLRRDTPHTKKAQHLFHRCFEEFGPFLINELPTRWLISVLQTFLEHGRNEHQRMIGASGYFFANLMKIYEGERALEGNEPDALYRNIAPQTKNMFPGLDRYNVGGTDLLLNVNALALDLANRDEVAGLVLQELLLRSKHSQNVFTRMDASRRRLKAHVKGFENTWSFFEEP